MFFFLVAVYWEIIFVGTHATNINVDSCLFLKLLLIEKYYYYNVITTFINSIYSMHLSSPHGVEIRNSEQHMKCTVYVVEYELFYRTCILEKHGLV